MGTVVTKFGGTSMADADKFRQVASIIKASPDRRYVVVSAPGKRFKGDSAMLSKVDAIVKTAAEKGTMSAMDSAHDSLLALVPPLAPSRP